IFISLVLWHKPLRWMVRAMIKRLLWIVTLVLLAIGTFAEAQQPAKAPRIGFLGGSSPSAISARIEAFRRGLRELGYVEGKNIVIEWRYAEGKFACLRWRPNWFASKWMSSSPPVRYPPVLPRKQLSRFPL